MFSGDTFSPILVDFPLDIFGRTHDPGGHILPNLEAVQIRPRHPRAQDALLHWRFWFAATGRCSNSGSTIYRESSRRPLTLSTCHEMVTKYVCQSVVSLLFYSLRSISRPGCFRNAICRRSTLLFSSLSMLRPWRARNSRRHAISSAVELALSISR